MAWCSSLSFDVDVFKIFRAVTIATVSAKLAIVYVLASVTVDAVFRCLQFSFRFRLVTVVAAKLFMCAIDGEICGFVMIEKPYEP